MTTPSGQISLGDVNTELGYSATAQISMNDAAVRGLSGVPSGAISMQNLQGKSNTFSFNLTSGTDLNLRTQALAAGWNGSSAVVATIPSGNTIQSSTTGGYALTINGSFPAGVTLVNNGVIQGRGGNGGAGGNVTVSSTPTRYAGSPGLLAGPALLVSVTVSINNIGSINGGGGGGGGGGSSSVSRPATGCCGGGGGGGIGSSTGGNGGVCSGSGTFLNGSAGSSGTLTTFGNGGSGGYYSGSIYGGTGGNGGTYGSSGSSGATAVGAGGTSGGSGGAAGACLAGNSNITWIATGTRNGAIT